MQPPLCYAAVGDSRWHMGWDQCDSGRGGCLLLICNNRIRSNIEYTATLSNPFGVLLPIWCSEVCPHCDSFLMLTAIFTDWVFPHGSFQLRIPLIPLLAFHVQVVLGCYSGRWLFIFGLVAWIRYIFEFGLILLIGGTYSHPYVYKLSMDMLDVVCISMHWRLAILWDCLRTVGDYFYLYSQSGFFPIPCFSPEFILVTR